MVHLRRSKRLATLNKNNPSSEIPPESAETNLISAVSDDLLLEILIRLPQLGHAITICKHWCSLIISDHPNTFHRHCLHHHRRRKNHDPDPSYTLPYTLLFRYRVDRPLIQVFSEKSKALHQILTKQEPFSGNNNGRKYLGFIPDCQPLVVRASFRDLLLVSRNRWQYYICNPLTLEWLALPEAPLMSVPERKPVSIVLVGSDDEDGFRYRVVIFSFDNTGMDGHHATVFNSETGHWNTSIVRTPSSSPLPRPFVGQIVTCDGLLRWPISESLHVFDPFRALDDPGLYRNMNFPAEFVRRSENEYKKTLRVGVVRGRLRLSQMLFEKKRSSFRVRIWEFDNGDERWSLVHEFGLRKEIDSDYSMVVVAFHPGDGDVIFLLRDCEIFRYEIKGEKYVKVGEIPSDKFPKGVNLLHVFLRVLVIVHPWPTKIPPLPSV